MPVKAKRTGLFKPMLGLDKNIHIPINRHCKIIHRELELFSSLKNYSTVTDLAKLRGQSTLQPLSTAKWYDRSCIGITVRMPWRTSTVAGISKTWSEKDMVSLSPFSQMIKGLPARATTWKWKWISIFWH